MTERVENSLLTFKTLSKHVMDCISWMLLIQEGDTKPREDLQHDDMTLKQSERLSQYAGLCNENDFKKSFDRLHKTILETRTLEIGEVQLMVFKEGDNPP